MVSPKHYVKRLRKLGAKIGENTVFYDLFLKKAIDVTRPTLIEIGDNVRFNDGCRLITHDFVSFIFGFTHHDFLPSSGKVKIGNNVALGINVTILKGVEIGDNCYIGAGAVVAKSIPSGSIAAGVPAKVICTIDEYYKKRQIEYVEEALAFADSIRVHLGREPIVSDFREEFPVFMDAHNVEDYPEQQVEAKMGRNYQYWLDHHKAPFSSFDEFIRASKSVGLGSTELS